MSREAICPAGRCEQVSWAEAVQQDRAFHERGGAIDGLATALADVIEEGPGNPTAVCQSLDTITQQTDSFGGRMGLRTMGLGYGALTGVMRFAELMVKGTLELPSIADAVATGEVPLADVGRAMVEAPLHSAKAISNAIMEIVVHDRLASGVHTIVQEMANLALTGAAGGQVVRVVVQAGEHGLRMIEAAGAVLANHWRGGGTAFATIGGPSVRGATVSTIAIAAGDPVDSLVSQMVVGSALVGAGSAVAKPEDATIPSVSAAFQHVRATLAKINTIDGFFFPTLRRTWALKKLLRTIEEQALAAPSLHVGNAWRATAREVDQYIHSAGKPIQGREWLAKQAIRIAAILDAELATSAWNLGLFRTRVGRSWRRGTPLRAIEDLPRDNVTRSFIVQPDARDVPRISIALPGEAPYHTLYASGSRPIIGAGSIRYSSENDVFMIATARGEIPLYDTTGHSFSHHVSADAPANIATAFQGILGEEIIVRTFESLIYLASK